MLCSGGHHRTGRTGVDRAESPTVFNAIFTSTQDAGRIRSFELIVHNTKTGSQIAIGRYEKRCMALLWHLAACVAFKRLHGVILLHKLIDVIHLSQHIRMCISYCNPPICVCISAVSQ